MRKLILILILSGTGLSTIAQTTNENRFTRRSKALDDWLKEMADFRAKSADERKQEAMADSIEYAQAISALKNKDFVLEAKSLTLKNAQTLYVNSITNFISLKGNKAVVQISPSNTYPGQNGLGGVTVSGTVSGLDVMTDAKGRTLLKMNVMGAGINAQVEISIYPGTDKASAVVYPNFNSNAIWIQGNLLPYDKSKVFEGNSL